MRWPWSSRAVPLALALQGGGAHGAFTWGVLDRLLEEPGLGIGAISGTSAGALNAVALAHGWCEGGREGARASLQRLWSAVGGRVPFELFTVGPAASPALNAPARALMHWMRLVSPYQFNPLGLNPLREIVADLVDFERLGAADAPRLFVAATHANSGRLRLFGNAELGLDAVLASTCLPSLQPAVTIAGEPYWDGGYSANPPLWPLLQTGIADLLIVALSPLSYPNAPVQADEIRERALEFAFNAAFLCEVRLLAEARAAAGAGAWPAGALERRLRRLRTHLVDAHDDLGALPAETRLIAQGAFLERLRDLGRARAERWLQQHGDAPGRRSSVDLARVFAPPPAA